MAKLFIANIPFKTTQEELWQFIEDAGFQVAEIQILTDKDTGSSKGYGFVALIDPTELPEAIKALDQSEIEGRKLAVSEAHPPKPKGQTRYAKPSPR